MSKYEKTEGTERKTLDTFSQTTYLVRLAQDPRVFPRTDGGEDVVLTFCDNTRIEGTEQLWVDARLMRFQADRGKKFRKNDEVQVTGKLRFKRMHDGQLRGKIYDAIVNSFVKTIDRDDIKPVEAGEKLPPAFE